jgi:hypothetical protein
MNQDDRFEKFVRGSLRELDPIADIPREEMWTRIAEARRFQRARPSRSLPAWAIWGVGIAAALVIGIGVGRWSALDRTAPQTSVAVSTPELPAPVVNGDSAAYRLAAVQHLGSVEVLLTSVSSGTVDPQVKAWATQMLSSTRYLMDSPAGNDPRMARLLADLELILAQVATATVNRGEIDLIQDGIKQTNVLPRLRATQSENSTVAGI